MIGIGRGRVVERTAHPAPIGCNVSWTGGAYSLAWGEWDCIEVGEEALDVGFVGVLDGLLRKLTTFWLHVNFSTYSSPKFGKFLSEGRFLGSS